MADDYSRRDILRKMTGAAMASGLTVSGESGEASKYERVAEELASEYDIGYREAEAMARVADNRTGEDIEEWTNNTTVTTQPVNQTKAEPANETTENISRTLEPGNSNEMEAVKQALETEGGQGRWDANKSASKDYPGEEKIVGLKQAAKETLGNYENPTKVVTDRKGRVHAVNDAGNKILGFPLDNPSDNYIIPVNDVDSYPVVVGDQLWAGEDKGATAYDLSDPDKQEIASIDGITKKVAKIGDYIVRDTPDFLDFINPQTKDIEHSVGVDTIYRGSIAGGEDSEGNDIVGILDDGYPRVIDAETGEVRAENFNESFRGGLSYDPENNVFNAKQNGGITAAIGLDAEVKDKYKFADRTGGYSIGPTIQGDIRQVSDDSGNLHLIRYDSAKKN